MWIWACPSLSSSDNSVATVVNGNTYIGANYNTATIKANSAGTTTITATSADGKKIAICQVTVNSPVPEFVDRTVGQSIRPVYAELAFKLTYEKGTCNRKCLFRCEDWQI